MMSWQVFKLEGCSLQDGEIASFPEDQRETATKGRAKAGSSEESTKAQEEDRELVREDLHPGMITISTSTNDLPG